MGSFVDIDRCGAALDAVGGMFASGTMRVGAVPSAQRTTRDCVLALERARTHLASDEPANALVRPALEEALAATKDLEAGLEHVASARALRRARLPIIGGRLTAKRVTSLPLARDAARAASLIHALAPGLSHTAADTREGARLVDGDATYSSSQAAAHHAPESFDRAGRLAQRAFRGIVNAAFIRPTHHEIIGAEHLPSGPYVLVGTHAGNLDALIAASAVDRPLRVMVARSVGRTPLLGPLATRFGAFVVERGGGKGRAAIDRAGSFLAAGDPVLVYPEGRRVLGPHLGEPKEGFGRIALENDVPIVPSATVGLKPDWVEPGVGHPVTIYGAPMRFVATGTPDEAAGAVTEQVWRRVTDLREDALQRSNAR